MPSSMKRFIQHEILALNFASMLSFIAHILYKDATSAQILLITNRWSLLLKSPIKEYHEINSSSP